MPAFFIHGVPDTAEMWDGVRARLQRKDVVAPSMPGFASPVPAGFDCTMDSYAAWLIAQIEATGGPVDIVGHDWGSMLTQRIVSLRPDLVRTWACGSGAVDPDYEWHPTAKIWQTPGAGEQLMDSFTLDAIVGAWKTQGFDDETARRVAEKIDDTMKSSILALYRSAANVGRDWTALAGAKAPGLVLWGADDPYVAERFGKRLAERNGAAFTSFAGCGHWWPYLRAAETAAALEALWER
jgi:pimeloyl-ACP methyl ester carboxylesterase